MDFVAADISILAANYKHFSAAPRDMVIGGKKMSAVRSRRLPGSAQFPVAGHGLLCDSLLMSQRD